MWQRERFFLAGSIKGPVINTHSNLPVFLWYRDNLGHPFGIFFDSQESCILLFLDLLFDFQQDVRLHPTSLLLIPYSSGTIDRRALLPELAGELSSYYKLMKSYYHQERDYNPFRQTARMDRLIKRSATSAPHLSPGLTAPRFPIYLFCLHGPIPIYKWNSLSRPKRSYGGFMFL